ncbi:hypothetical protein MMC11_009008 [Xylographa trunciseda]|nr:hypothetical protein [Xylographa trunciseda]
MSSATLIKPPPIDPSKSPIENVLELTTLKDIGPDIYTNTRPLWHPPGARGIYGGAVIAQSLAAAQRTIPPPSSSNNRAVFLIHSMHCYFVLAGDASIPILYHVERVREGKSFMTRTVQARQRGKCIFTTTASFMREGSGGRKTVDHEWGMPDGVRAELEKGAEEEDEEVKLEKASNGEEVGAFESRRLEILNSDSAHPHTKRARQWFRARGHISASSGPQAHLSALAYMSDNYFIGTVSRVHNLWRFGRPPAQSSNTISSNSVPPTPSTSVTTNPSSATPSTRPAAHPMALLESVENAAHPTAPSIGMMVSLDHTIYFHRPGEIRADEWLFSEMESPWAGDGRGLVLQRIWNRKGVLVASCVQEGLVRLKQGEDGQMEGLVRLKQGEDGQMEEQWGDGGRGGSKL